MRSVEDLRKRWLEMIPTIMKRVGMYASTGREMQLLAGQLLADLCFLDDRDADWKQARSQLRSYGQLGVAGPFEALFGSPRCQAEVASVYAEVFHRLGYLVIDNPVSQQRWQELTGSLRDRFEDRDVRQSEARHILGEPSLLVGRRILCYAAADRAAGWLFVDCHAEQVRRYDVGHGRYTADHDTDPLVRSVRVPGPDFEAGLILTLYGKTLRWGPGWWIDHPVKTCPQKARQSPPSSATLTQPTRRRLFAAARLAYLRYRPPAPGSRIATAASTLGSTVAGRARSQCVIGPGFGLGAQPRR